MWHQLWLNRWVKLAILHQINISITFLLRWYVGPNLEQYSGHFYTLPWEGSSRCHPSDEEAGNNTVLLHTWWSTVLVWCEFLVNRILVPDRTTGLAGCTKGNYVWPGRIIPLSETLTMLGVHLQLQSMWAFLRPTRNALWCMHLIPLLPACLCTSTQTTNQ
jgi:hypothetical protein